MKKLLFILCIVLLSTNIRALDWPYAFQSKTGSLSYSLFNLSPYAKCEFIPYGRDNNPEAIEGSLAQRDGWSSGSGVAGFFNWPFSSNDASQTIARRNYVFWDAEDRLQEPTPPVGSLAIGIGTHTVEYSDSLRTFLNPQAIADSWVIQCTEGNTTSSGVRLPDAKPIVMAGVASSSNLLESGEIREDIEFLDNRGGSTFAYAWSLEGWFANEDINPPSPGGNGKSAYMPNVNGMGFTHDTLNFNLPYDPTGQNQTGGLWLGVENKNGKEKDVNGNPQGAYAAASLNFPIYPVNLSAYVENPEDETSPNGMYNPEGGEPLQVGIYYRSFAGAENYRPTTKLYHKTAAPIFGGHFTLAVGDPFLINSYAAKILWSLVSSPKFALQNNQVTAQKLIETLVASDKVPVFKPNSKAENYLKWLLNSPQKTAIVVKNMITAANEPIEHTQLAGKIFAMLAKTTVNVMLSAAGSALGGPAGAAVVGAYGGVGNALLAPSYTTPILNAYTSTLSLPPPVAADAPPIINPTYAAENLLGMLLANVVMQTEISSALGASITTPLWSNYTIHTSNLCRSIDVTENLLSGECKNSSGNYISSGNRRYDNPLSTRRYDYTKLSLWNAILNGANIGVDTVGYMQLQNPVSNFSPPVQVISKSGSKVVSIDTTFDKTSGLLAVTSYTANAKQFNLNGPFIPVPAELPPLKLVIIDRNSNNIQAPDPTQITYTVSNNVYNTSTFAYLYISGYKLSANSSHPGNHNFVNGKQRLEVSSCPPNTSVLLTIYPMSSGEVNALGFLSCQANPTLPYNLCSNDLNATGGVVAVVLTEPQANGSGATFDLGCVCNPSYLGGSYTEGAPEIGPSKLHGVFVGARALYPDARCR